LNFFCFTSELSLCFCKLLLGHLKLLVHLVKHILTLFREFAT
jgi:hypothetical protein